jgi:two-component system chemotaxis sensor kinase CheA
MVPVDYMFDRLSRAAKRLSGELSKEVAVEFSGGDTKLDKSMIEELADPLMHIIRNAVDHGIECEKIRLERGKPAAGTIKVMVSQKERGILIEVEDDGGGIDINKIYDVALGKGLIKRGEQIDEKRLIGFIFQPGFSTSKTVNDVSGRGVGLDVVAKNIAHLSGMIDVDTRSEKGTKFRITLPLTLLIVRALIVSESGREFAIPFNSISENLILRDSNVKKIGGREVIDIRGNFMPLIRLKDILRFAGEGLTEGGAKEKDKRYVVVIGVAEKRAGIVVDKIKGQREVLIKPLGKLLCNVSCVSGFAEIDAKKILPVLDPLKIII